MAVVQHCKDEVRLQQCANTIALMARKLSKDPKVRLSLQDMFLFITCRMIFSVPVAIRSERSGSRDRN